MNIDLNPEEILRYSRHLVIPEIGLQGQMKLKNASVLIVGCGGLGSPIALYLAAAGIGRIGIVDYDVVELSNLQRQIIYDTNRIGTSKVRSAKKYLEALNSDIQIDAYEETFSSKNAEEISAPYGIIIDGTDNIPTRYLLNDLCVLTGKPYIYGAVYRFSGQVGVFDASQGACYRCVFPEPPPPESVPSCSVVGVVGVVPGIIGLLQAAEVIKLILGVGTPLVSKLMVYDALDSRAITIDVPKRKSCKICGLKPEIDHLIDYEKFCKMTIRDQSLSRDEFSISPLDLKDKLLKNENIRLIDLREPVEIQISRIPNSENVPFHKLQDEMARWNKLQPLVLICHIGFLSKIARRMLFEAGFKNVSNLEGGIRRWAQEVDPSSNLY